MRAIANAMRLQALRASGVKISSRYGTVTGYDPHTYSVKVSIQPEGIATGFIPLAALWAGSGWGLFAPPSANDQVSVIFVDGDFNAGYAECCFFNSALQPLPVPSGELWMVHASGQSIKLTNDGKLTLNDGHGASVQLDGAGHIASQGAWTHTGTLAVTDTAHFEKDVQVDQTLNANTDVVGGGVSLIGHEHTSASPGSPTSPPI